MHNKGEYDRFYEACKGTIVEAIPNAKCLFNEVPKPWFEQDIYCQLIPNEDDKNPNYGVLPRLGAFEVSTVREG